MLNNNVENVWCGEKNTGIGGLKTLTAEELLALEFPERKHLVKPWLREGESTMIFAAPGVGKSLFALELALGIAGRGPKVVGLWKTVQPWKVLYVDGEMPVDDIRDRIRMLLEKPEDLEALRGNLSILARCRQKPGVEFIDLANGETREGLLRKVVEEKFDLVILDNLSTLASIEDENAAGMFNETVKFLQHLKQAGIACMLIHHSNKAGDSFRGSSKLATTFETIIQLKVVGDEDVEEEEEEEEEGKDTDTDMSTSTSFKLLWTKYRGRRDGSTKDGLVFTLTSRPRYGFGEGVLSGGLVGQWAWTNEEDAKIGRMLVALRSGAYSNQTELAEALGVTKGTISKWKTRMIEAGRVAPKEWKRCLGWTGDACEEPAF